MIYAALIGDLESWLAEITGLPAVSLQPNAGSQGEFAGLLAIRRYHDSRGDTGRNVCLIPVSAHGTNAAHFLHGQYAVTSMVRSTATRSFPGPVEHDGKRVMARTRHRPI